MTDDKDDWFEGKTFDGIGWIDDELEPVDVSATGWVAVLREYNDKAAAEPKERRRPYVYRVTTNLAYTIAVLVEALDQLARWTYRLGVRDDRD